MSKYTSLAQEYLSGYALIAFPDTEEFWQEVQRLSGAPEPEYDLEYFQSVCSKVAIMQEYGLI